MGSKIVFLFFVPNTYLAPGKKRQKKTYVIQLAKGYKNHHHVTLDDT
jgi:hypothetical protein